MSTPSEKALRTPNPITALPFFLSCILSYCHIKPILMISHRETKETQRISTPRKSNKAQHLNPPEEDGYIKPNFQGITGINSHNLCVVPNTVPET